MMQTIGDFLIDYVLKPKGFEVIIATNGIDGLKLATAYEFHLMIIDNQMPRLTGLELLRTLRDTGLQVPAIMMTAHGSEAIAVEAFRLGIRDYVIKPFEVNDMAAAIDRTLRESRLERERNELTRKLTNNNIQLQQRVQELNTLYGIGRSVSSSLKPQEVLNRVVEGAVYMSKAEEGALLLLDDARNELYVQASKNLNLEVSAGRMKIAGSFAGEALRSRQPLIIGEQDPIQRQFLQKNGLKAMIYIPLMAQDEPLGILSVSNRHRDIVFTDHEARILSPLADYAAIAIRNARLFAESENERNKLGTVISQTSDPILLIDERGRLAIANQAALLALNIPARNSIGQPITNLLPDKNTISFMLQEPDINFTPQGEIVTKDGRIFNANMTLIQGVGRSLLMRDITQMKEIDRLKSELVSIVSHDLRSPLTSILGYVELLQRVGPINDQQKVFIERILKSVNNITTLISDLLDLSRLEAGVQLALTPCAVDELLNQIVTELQTSFEEKEQNFIVKIGELPQIMADNNRLHQAFSNLLGNAIKYTPQKGKVRLGAYERDGQIIISISDTGIGIKAEDLSYIFDKFYRAENVVSDYQGTGLGLSIVKSVIEKHQGRIWAKSEVGKGSTFSVVLPATKSL